MQGAAIELIDEAIDVADDLNAGVVRLDNGATVLDLGLEAEGGYEAGLVLAELRCGGLVATDVRGRDLGDTLWPVVDAITDRPVAAIERARARDTTDDGHTLTIPTRDDGDVPFAVAIAETTTAVTEAGAATIADHLGVSTDELYVASVRPGHASWCVAAAATDVLLAVGATLDAEGRLDDLAGALLRVGVAPASDDPAEAHEAVQSAMARTGRAHLRFHEPPDPEVVDRLVDDSLAQVTATGPVGGVVRRGATDPEGFFEAIR